MTRRLLVTITLGAALSIPWRATAEDGATVYKAQCAKCHGDTGEADTATAKTLKVPKLKGDAKVGGMSIPDIVAAVKANEKHKSFIKKLTDEQVAAAAGQAKQVAAGK
jgi:mono/diheme cytochrome c family protein